MNFRYTNSSQTAITLNINGTGAKAIYINGTASSASNYTLPAGSYIAYYDGTNYQFRTDGLLPGPGIVGNAATASQVYVTNTVPTTTTSYYLTYTNSTTSGN